MSAVFASLGKSLETSDSDEELNTSKSAVVVEGEAPESDDEEANGDLQLEDENDNSPPTPTPETPGSHFTSFHTSFDDSPKYDTLLHKKLREKNEQLKQELLNIACLPYNNATKEIASITQQLVKSQKMVQNVSSSLRRCSKELALIENTLDSIRTNKSLLPKFFNQMTNASNIPGKEARLYATADESVSTSTSSLDENSDATVITSTKNNV